MSWQLKELTTGHRSRIWLLCNILVQILSLAVCVLLVQSMASPHFQPEGDFGWVYLLILAMQGGIQVTQVRYSASKADLRRLTREHANCPPP